MCAKTTDATIAALERLEAMLNRCLDPDVLLPEHERIEMPNTNGLIVYCEWCQETWPCGIVERIEQSRAAVPALCRALRLADQALAFYANRDNIRVALGSNALNPHVRALNARAAIAAELEAERG